MQDDEHISVSFATLHLLTENLEDILKALNESLHVLQGRAEKVVLSWNGEAREAFIDKLDEWDRSARDLQATQKLLHTMATTGHANYAAAHQAVLRGWGGGS
ncbi:WXG100 family type VII secretion target [Streptomyces sp. NPDC054863]